MCPARTHRLYIQAVQDFVVAALRYLPYGSCLYSRRGQASHAHHDYILTDAQARMHAYALCHCQCLIVIVAKTGMQACSCSCIIQNNSFRPCQAIVCCQYSGAFLNIDQTCPNSVHVLWQRFCH